MPDLGVLRSPESVRFGAGAAGQTGAVVARYGKRVVVCTDDNLASSPSLGLVTDSIRRAGCEVEVLAAAEPELPLPGVEAAIATAAAMKPDCLVALGGGSSLDLAKLVGLGLSAGLPLQRWYGENAVPGPTIPVVALPTTAGTGSEVTPVAVLTDPDRALKVGISSEHLIPRAAICDPLLTHGAPTQVAAFAGIDALAHAIEAYCAVARPSWEDMAGRVFVGRNVLSDTFALRAIGLIGKALPDIGRGAPATHEAMTLGSLNAGLAFGTAGTGLAHALQYPVGARTHTAHGLGIGLLLPFTMAYNAAAVPTRMADVARALGAGEDAAAAVRRVRELALAVGIPAGLADIGVPAGDLPTIAEQALTITRLIENNARAADGGDLLAVLEEARDGDPENLLGSAEAR